MLGYIIWAFGNKNDMKTSLDKKQFSGRDCFCDYFILFAFYNVGE